MSKELDIYTGEVLTEEEQKALNLELDHIINAHKNNRQEINKLVFECVSAMSEADSASDELSGKGFFSGLWGSITGSNRRLQNTINRNRAAAQYASQQCLQKLAEQNLMTFDLITAVNNKLNASLIKVDAEFNKVYAVLVKFFKQNKSELVRLETRLEKVEKNVNLLNWQNSIEYQEFDGVEYAELDPISKIVCLTKDFYDITKGNWSTSDLLLLKTAMSTIELNPKDVINYYDAVKVIAEDDKLKYKLFESTNLVPVKEPQYLISASGIQKISAVNNEEKHIVSSIEGYINEKGLKIENEELLDEVVQNYMAEKADVDLNVEIECYDFVLDLLYNLQGYEEEADGYSGKMLKKAKKVLVPDGKIKENFDLIKELAENGNATAMYLLAQYFRSYEFNMEKFKEWLSKAIEAGEALAKIRWYSEFEQEKELDKNVLEEVLNMAENDNIYAMFELGRYYDLNKVNKNYEEAVKWYEKAAEQGYPMAQVNLGLMYDDGRGVEQNYEKALELYRKAAEQGHITAQNIIGNMYENGRGVEQNYEEAAKWYRKAAEQGNSAAQNNLGLMYYYGKGVEEDDKKALEWYRKAAEQGNTAAQNNIGLMYENGYGVEQNYEEAVKWYRKTAEQGNAFGQNALGYMYYAGYGVVQNFDKALKWCRKAEYQGNDWVTYCMGYKYCGVEQSYLEAVKWFRKAAEQGNAVAQNNLGNMYFKGYGVEQNPEEAEKWYRKADEQGNANAQNNLGWMYYKGYLKGGYREAIKWFRKAAEQGLADAQYNIGIMYYFGEGVDDEGPEAVEWLRKASDQGHAAAQFTLGGMYYFGDRVRRNLTEAKRLYRESANQGYSRGRDALADW